MLVPADMAYEEWHRVYVRGEGEAPLGDKEENEALTGEGKAGTMAAGDSVSINSPNGSNIESPHPVDVLFGAKGLSPGQQRILDDLPESGSQTMVRKRDASMLDLAALTAATGDEFAMFTLGAQRLVVRGDEKNIHLYENDLRRLSAEGYRWSGHTHPGRDEVNLIESSGDRRVLELFNQNRSAVYNAAGRYRLFGKGD